MPARINHRQKIFIAVFAIAISGLVLDRVWLLPSQAQEDAPSAPGRPSEGLLLNLEVTPTSDIPGQKLTDHLRTLSDRYESSDRAQRDAFALPSDWGRGGREQDVTGLSTTAAVFVQRHQLKAVAALGSRGKAYINDRVVNLGETLDGFTLVSLQEDAALFEREGETVTLELTKTP